MDSNLINLLSLRCTNYPELKYNIKTTGDVVTSMNLNYLSTDNIIYYHKIDLAIHITALPICLEYIIV